MRKKGVSLIALMVVMAIIIILSGTVTISILNNNVVFDSSKRATFMNDFRTVQEAVNMYAYGNYNMETGEFSLPLRYYLTEEEKTHISEKETTLNTKIEELSGPVKDLNLAWINHELVDLKLSNKKSEKGYIIDVDNGQIYDYIGDVFEKKSWHTLDGGVELGDNIGEEPEIIPVITEEMWDGWIKLTLYYPSNSTNRKWRLGTEGELRVDPMLMWQNYVGPITIPIDRTKDVWIKYDIDDREVIIPPAGTLLVDIMPDKTGYAKVPFVKVKINYDEEATTKEYRVGSSGWMTYSGEFTVTENCVIEARAKKTETIYDELGNLILSRDIAGRDLVYIGNIGIEETELEPPTITRLPGEGDEKARVRVTYPENAVKKVYKVNYGVEEQYKADIPVTNYGTYIIAYYYDSNNKRSKAVGIRINDKTGGVAEDLPEDYKISPPYEPGSPPPQYEPGDYGINIPAPIINVNPTSIVEETEVSVSAPANANKIYIKQGRYGSYEEYTNPIKVRQNMQIYAYYRTLNGERSDTGYRLVNNIKKKNKPYVRIDADPYPWSWNYGADEVKISLYYTDTDKIEYSEDGITFKLYTGEFVVSENKTIYARGTNIYGVTEEKLNITNIGKIKAPKPIQKIAISINVNPEPLLATERVEKVKVTIDYDDKAIEKYYSIGRFGQLKEYKGPFEVTSNCTIYAYGKGENAQGSANKIIDNVSNGISDPLITAIPANGQHASKVKINISYDKYATVTRYSINGGTLRDYAGEFEVGRNGTVIYAYSQNALGQSSEATYTLENIVPEPPVLFVNMGQYYILKLSYPDGAEAREYKWKEDGQWKAYNDIGIMLIKSQYREELLKDEVLIKVKDENGNLITFTGDYYFIDVPISELSENLFMRWDRFPLGAPQIIITPTEAAKQVEVKILYNNALVKKQYKVITPDSDSNKWLEYTSPITVDRNNTVIYARGMDDAEVWTSESVKKITNIDENPPVLKLSADLNTAMQRVAVKVSVTDDVAVGKIKYQPGILGESYFTNGGKEIMNNSIVNITENGYYTFYAEDKVGNKQVYTLNVTNVDLTPPAIDIQVSSEGTVGLYTNVTIDYGDAVTKQYKVGTSNSTWSNYTNTFEISSYTILSNKWQDVDGTVTIYAKGKDSSGNEITVLKKVVNLDLDMPKEPVIHSKSNYAILTEYGTRFDATTTITYDSRTDIDNYYSVDNGATWLTYSGQFQMANGSVIAKSVKKSTGLEKVVSKTINMPSDAMKPQAYDGNTSTFSTENSGQGKLYIDSSMQGKSVLIKMYKSSAGYNGYLHFLGTNNNVIATITLGYGHSYEGIYTIPSGTVSTSVTCNGGYMQVYEIQPSNEPRFRSTNGYMVITANPTQAEFEPYQMVSIDYFATSVQRLYRIGTEGAWKTYNDQPIKVMHGQTIYAKGIDKSGYETRIISSLTINVTDAMKKQAYDSNITTYSTEYNGAGRMDIDSSMRGKSIRIKMHKSSAGYDGVLNFLDSSGTIISKITLGYGKSYDAIYTIPSNAVRTSMYCNGGYMQVYEIEPSNEPTFTPVNGYMTITADPTKAIYEPYQMVTINYFPTSAQRLYRIGTEGNWISYGDKPVKVNHGQTIYAKGIDRYGNETRIISSLTINVTNGMKKQAYDGDINTFSTEYSGAGIMEIDPSMRGRNVRIKMYKSSAGYDGVLNFLDSSGAIISKITLGYGKSYDAIYTIPSNAVRTSMYCNGGYMQVFEIDPSNEPTFSPVNGYMTITADPTKAIYEPYQMVTINYFPTSVQRLYRIGTVGEWLTYNNQAVKVNHGETIYAKGIDTYGNETRIIQSLTINVTNGMKKQAYDGDITTYSTENNGAGIMDIDSSMRGRNVRIKMHKSSAGYEGVLNFLDSNGTIISKITLGYGKSYDAIYTIPANAVRIYIYCNGGYMQVYEIEPSNEPTYSTVDGFMVLASDSEKSIYEPYKMVTINYFPTSVQRLYRIGTEGNWINYNNEPVKVIHGETIYAKGIDVYGNETRITQVLTIDVTTAMNKEAYDGNFTTYSTEYNGGGIMEVDPSVRGKNARIKLYKSSAGYEGKLNFLNSSGAIISSITIGYGKSYDGIYTIPANAVRTSVYCNGGYMYVYEIEPQG